MSDRTRRHGCPVAPDGQPRVPPRRPPASPSGRPFRHAGCSTIRRNSGSDHIGLHAKLAPIGRIGRVRPQTLTKLFPVTLYAKQDSGRFLSPFSSLQTTHQLLSALLAKTVVGLAVRLTLMVRRRESAVSNHESPTVSAAILRD